MKPANFLAALVLVFAGLRYWEERRLPPTPSPDQPTVSVPADIAAIVAPLKGSLSDSPAKARELAAIFTQLARVVERDAGGSLKATGQLARVTSRLIELAAVPAGSPVGTKINDAIGQSLGIVVPGGYQDTAITPAMRARLVATLHGLAQAFGG